MKKIYIALAIITLITLMSSIVFAATTSKFEVVDDQVCTIKINDYCTFEKRMTSYDLDKRQVTIQLKITNDAPANQPTGEVMLLLDNSGSMEDPTSTGAKRGETVFSSAKTLIQKMLKDNSHLKVGIARFSSTIDLDREGTMEDTAIVSELSNDISTLNTAIDNIQNDGITETEQEYENVNDSPSQNQRIEVMIDRANKKIESIITDLEEDYATKLELSSAITQSSSDILATVSATYTTQETTSQIQATLQLKVNTADLVSEINASADTITLTAGRLVISSGNFQLDSSGNITANGGTIAGWNIVGTRLEKDNTSISGGYRSGMQNLSSGGGAVFYAGCNTAAGGTIASESASNFYVTQAGYLYCSNAKIGGTINSSSGNIGGFTLSSNSLSGSLSGLYDYDYFDLASVRGYIMGWIGGDSILKNIWDYDNSSSVTSTDYVNILNTIKGTLQNTKTMTGSFIINTTDPKRCIRIKKGNTDAVSIGLNGIESNLINTDELICGKIEFDEDPQGPSYFSGIIMRNNGTLVFLNQDVEKAKITKAGALTATSMSTNGFRVPEILKGGVDITPSAANTPTGLAISFSSSFSATPIVVATANTGAPGTQVTGVGVSGRSTTGCTLYVTRTNTTTTGIQWIAMN